MSIFCLCKQKTADDVRISYWSSDVCSSDLLAKGGDNAVRYRQPLVGRPGRSRGRVDHEGNIGAGWPPKPQTRRQLTDMIRHCLIPRRIVGQLGYVQTKLLRDERSEERRVGTECVSTCRSRWSP